MTPDGGFLGMIAFALPKGQMAILVMDGRNDLAHEKGKMGGPHQRRHGLIKRLDVLGKHCSPVCSKPAERPGYLLFMFATLPARLC